MSGGEIESPYAIATLAKPLDSKHGRTRIAAVHGIRGSRKRKRHEVAVGVDGEGVNVYNTNSQRLVASYALPPQSYLCCAPCSLYLHSTDSTTAPTRRTYLVVRDKVGDSKRRLVCFTETVGKGRESQNDISTPDKIESALENGEIVSLDAYISEPKTKLSVAVSYASGRVTVASEGLEKTQTLQLHSRKTDVLEYATTVDLNAARRGLLRSREDVVASVGRGANVLIGAISRHKNVRSLRLYSLRPSIHASLQAAEPAVRVLLDQSLPQQTASSSSSAEFELHAAAGTLYQHIDSVLSIYDLTTTSARLLTTCGTLSSPILSFARISESLALASKSNAVALYETKYGSVYGSVHVQASRPASSQGKKRKRGTNDDTSSIEQLCSVSESGPVVGIRGQELVVIPLGNTLQTGKRARSQGTRLVDIFTRSQVHSQSRDDLTAQRTGKSERWTTTVDKLVEADDIEGLEKLVASDPHLGEQLGLDVDSDHDERGNEFHDHDRTAYEDLWPLPEPFDSSRLHRQKAQYIVAQMFNSTSDGLALQIISLKLLEWLALSGLLSAGQISQALRSHREQQDSDRVQSSPGDVMLALRPFDEDFQLSHELLSLPVRWEVEEVIQVLRAVVQSFDEPTNDESQPTLALPAITDLPNGNTQTTNDPTVNGNGIHPSEEEDGDLDLVSETQAAEQELDNALTALSHGLEVKSDTLRLVFTKLLSYDPLTVTAQLRALMSHRELIFFIHVLRIELAEGGWTSRYIGAGDDEGETAVEQHGMVNAMEGAEGIANGIDGAAPSNDALRTIGDLLNCAVDAIGTSGWLVGLGGSNLVTARDLLTSLRAEISAGLEQCYEADTLGSALAEIERFAADVEREDEAGAAGPGIEEGKAESDAMLPMGGRVKPVVVDGRGGAVGKKSVVVKAMEKSRRVGRYEFDRIRI